MRIVHVVTGSRAEYGLLVPLLAALSDARGLALKVIVTGSHLSPHYGDTVQAVERDGWPIAAKIAMALKTDDGAAISNAIAQALTGFAAQFESDRPDLLMMLGDRYELLAPAIAAMMAGIPVAHLCGGDVTEGAYDDSIRHSLTKMAHLHFPTNHESARRIVQLGETPGRIFNVGLTGLDDLPAFLGSNRAKIAAEIGVDPERPWLLFTFHPVTRTVVSSQVQLAETLAALKLLTQEGYQIVATQPNADHEGRLLSDMLEQWAADNPHVHIHGTLGRRRYLQTMEHAGFVIGNSSSGLTEAPSIPRPTVNIGTRQDGRPRATSVIDCKPERGAILSASKAALALDLSGTVNPFGRSNASARIVDIIAGLEDFVMLLNKSFHDLPAECFAN